MPITFPQNTGDIIDQIRGAIGRPVEFYVISNTEECSVCSLDPVTNTSTDSFCPACSGLYYIYTYSGITISGHVAWPNADEMAWHMGGQLFDGDVRVSIKHSDTNVTILERTEYAVVDGRRTRIKKISPRGVPTLNRIVISMIEEDRDNE